MEYHQYHDPYVLQPRSGPASSPSDNRPPVYKAVGISLAIASGVFIGVSFVLKKKGLLKANVKYNEEAGEGYGYLKNAFWWTGMTLMIIGEICNFVAYAFVDAILVTPLGALSVVITTILSAIFLKERLSFVGKVGCFMCIIGSVVIVMNAPAQSSAGTIQEMKHFVLAPGFLVYAGLVIAGCTFVALWVGPRYGKKSMLVYLSICSLIGGLSVVATQGLGAAVVSQIAGKPQFNQWFLYVLFVFVIATLLTEIIYLNKALNIFNAALVTPTYYVYFTSATIVTSAILFQGFKGTPTSIITVVMGFLVICSGVVLLQLSKSAKDVPDAAVFKGDLDQVRTVAEQEEPESEPKADAIRGTAAIIRRISMARQKMEVSEAKRIHEDRMRDQLEPLNENEQVEWDGLRRRKTVVGGPGSLKRTKTNHPPLGMTHFPDQEHDYDDEIHHEDGNQFMGGVFNSFRRKHERKDSLPSHSRSVHASSNSPEREDLPKRPYTEVVNPSKLATQMTDDDTSYHPHSASSDPNAMEMEGHVYGMQRSPSISEHRGNRPIMWADSVNPPRSGSAYSHDSFAPPPPPHSANKRQFSFQNVFGGRQRGSSHVSPIVPSHDGPFDESGPAQQQERRHHFGLGHRRGSNNAQSKDRHVSNKFLKNATEEERLGLVKGDSNATLPTGSGSGSGSGDEMLSRLRSEQQLGPGAGSASAHDPFTGGSGDDEEEYYDDSSGWEDARRRVGDLHHLPTGDHDRRGRGRDLVTAAAHTPTQSQTRQHRADTAGRGNSVDHTPSGSRQRPAVGIRRVEESPSSMSSGEGREAPGGRRTDKEPPSSFL